jgi:anti-anti-sigma regulatory factor
MQINGLKADNFEIKVINQNNQIKIQWFGRSEARNPAELLNPYFENMLSKLKDKQVAIDYTELEFMNSSVPQIHKILLSKR